MPRSPLQDIPIPTPIFIRPSHNPLKRPLTPASFAEIDSRFKKRCFSPPTSPSDSPTSPLRIRTLLRASSSKMQSSSTSQTRPSSVAPRESPRGVKRQREEEADSNPFQVQSEPISTPPLRLHTPPAEEDHHPGFEVFQGTTSNDQQPQPVVEIIDLSDEEMDPVDEAKENASPRRKVRSVRPRPVSGVSPVDTQSTQAVFKKPKTPPPRVQASAPQ